MSTFKVKISGEIIVLKTASDNTRLKLAVNRFIKVLESLTVLNENIDKISTDEFLNTEEKTKQKSNKRI